MAILNIKTESIGEVGVTPRVIIIDTNDTLATVTTTGYLNHSVKNGTYFSESDMALVSTRPTPSSTDITVGWLEVSRSGADWSLVPPEAPGSVDLPTTANYIAHFTNTTGNLSSAAANVINPGNIQAGLSGTAGVISSFPATAARGKLNLTGVANTGNTDVTISNAAHGQATVVSIPDGGQTTTEFIIADSAGTQHITSGGLQVDAGLVSSGLAAGGFVGGFTAYPTTGARGSFKLEATANTGDTLTKITNAAMGQASTLTVPDPGASAANFLLDTGSANILAMQQFLGIQNIVITSGGTWLTVRAAQGNYVNRKNAADDTSIICFDITPMIRTTASKGWRLDSFDVMYTITVEELDAHTITLDRIAYANNVAVSVTSVPLTGSLSVATQANPYLTNIAVTTPAFDITADSKYAIEITVDAKTNSVYDFNGIMLRFSQTIG